MNRYDIAKGKKSEPKQEPEKISVALRIEDQNQQDNYFYFLHGLITLTDSDGNRIEGYIQDMQVNIETPHTPIKFMGQKSSELQCLFMQTTRLNMSILVDRTILKSARPAPTRPSSGGMSVP